MSQGDALVVAAVGTCALLLASRALQRSRLSLPVKAGMAAVWAVIIVFGAMIAGWWQR